MCLKYATYEPEPKATAVYERLFKHYRDLYFALGRKKAEAAPLGAVLPELRKIAAEACEV
jgi:L-ribulokinase